MKEKWGSFISELHSYTFATADVALKVQYVRIDNQ